MAAPPLDPKQAQPSRSGKYMKFIEEPMRSKSVREVPGLQNVLGRKLDAARIDRAYMVFGQYLICGKQRVDFIDWLTSACDVEGMDEEKQECFDCMKDWGYKFFK